MTGETHQRWLNSEQLDFAWFGFASEYEKEQYRNARTEHRMEALSIMMKTELISKIHSEYLYCYGLRIAPNLSEGPERIPSFLFAELSNKGPLLENIDWGKSSAGREYVQVRVSSVPEFENERQPSKTPKIIGRPPVGEQLRAVVRELNHGGRFSGKSRKETGKHRA
jgi:hypothetical protein